MVPAPCYPARLRALLTHLLPSSLVPRSSVQAVPRPLARGAAAGYGVAEGLALALALCLCFTIAAVEADGVGGGEKVA